MPIVGNLKNGKWLLVRAPEGTTGFVPTDEPDAEIETETRSPSGPPLGPTGPTGTRSVDEARPKKLKPRTKTS